MSGPCNSNPGKCQAKQGFLRTTPRIPSLLSCTIDMQMYLASAVRGGAKQAWQPPELALDPSRGRRDGTLRAPDSQLFTEPSSVLHIIIT